MNEMLLSLVAFIGIAGAAYATTKYPWLPLLGLWFLPVIKGWAVQRYSFLRVVDLTVLVTVWLLVAILMNLRNRGRINTPETMRIVSLHLALALLMAMGLAYSTAPSYGTTKLVKFCTLSFVSLIAPLVIIDTPRQLKAFLSAFVGLACFTAIVMVFFPSNQTLGSGEISTRQSAFEANVLNPAFLVAVGASFVPLVFNTQEKIRSNLPVFGLIIFMVFAIFISGSRSMFVQPLLALGIWALVQRGGTQSLGKYVAIAVVLAVPIWLASDPSNQGSRVATILKNPIEGFTGSGRMAMWEYAFWGGVSSPFAGNGTGSFAMDFFRVDDKEFPHNIFLEAFYEMGIIALGVLVILVMNVLQIFKRRFNRAQFPLVLCCGAATVAAVFSVSFHWDIADNRLLWNLFGILMLAGHFERQEI